MILAPAATASPVGVLLLRALTGAAVSRRALTQFRTVIYGLASSFMWRRLCVCVQMFVVGAATGRQVVSHFVLFKRCESGKRLAK